jgi:hypothetical protein
MKKLLQAATILVFISTSLFLIPSSCTKSQAQTETNTAQQLNKFVWIRLASSGVPQIWISDYSGNNATQVPISMPPGAALSTDFGTMDVKLSPDGQTVFFMGVLPATDTRQIYACNIDGSNVRVVVPNAGNTGYIKIGGAY